MTSHNTAQSGSSRRRLSATDVSAAFADAGVRTGDTILVHSGLWAIGPLERQPVSPVHTFLSGVEEAVGREGTIAVPASNRSYGGSGVPYDARRSPIDRDLLGVFSEYVVELPGAVRGINPVASMAAIGPQAEWLCGAPAGAAYGADSPWERFHTAAGKMAFVGIDCRFMTFVHYVEHRVGVPHLYNKFYPMGVSADGHPLRVPISAQVRYLDYEIAYRVEEFTAVFEKAGLITTARLGKGWIRVLNAADVYSFLKSELQKNFWFLLRHPPRFATGEVPVDGPTGAPID